MNNHVDYSLTPGYSRKIKIVNHHSSLLDGKCGFLVGKDIGSFYNYRVWLEHDNIMVIVGQMNIVPAEENACSLVDVFIIQAKIYIHNLAMKIQAGLRK